MPVIQAINASNASFIFQYGKYTDFNLWIIIVLLSIILLIVSRYLPAKDDVGKFLISVLSIVFAFAAIWGSLGIAYFDYTPGVTVVDNQSINESINYHYVYPVEKVVTSPWITGLCIVLFVLSILNAADIILTMLQRPSEEELRKRGRGLRI